MAVRRPDKRSRLISAAIKLFGEQGYTRTSLAEIAAAARVSLGNVYYYFKTKDDLGEAVVQYLSAGSRAMQELWDARESSPIARLDEYIQMHLDRACGVVDFGCSIAGLYTEFRKSNNRPLADQAASIYGEVLAWMRQQFELLGRQQSEAQDLAARLLCAVQGAVLVSHVLNDRACLERELNRLQSWLRGL